MIYPFKYIFLLKQVSRNKLTISELAGELGEKPPNTCKMVTRLEKLGFVKKSFAGVKRYIVLTDAGKKILEGVKE